MTLTRSRSFVLVAGLVAGLLFTFIGAAEALDTPKPASDTVQKGDRVAEAAAAPVVSLTVEEVNLDLGVSNLIRIERERRD